MTRLATFLALGLALAGCAADRPPAEVTADGLVRVPSDSVGGVYRDPDASFIQYQRVMLEPPTVSFVKNWARNHPEIGKADRTRIRDEAIAMFREEFAREFIEGSPYQFAEDPAPDVLLVVPAIEDLDIKTPDGTQIVKDPVTMWIYGDLRDAVTGKLLGQVLLLHLPDKNFSGKTRTADRVGNAHEQKMVYATWARLVREALNVAKTERPRQPLVAPAPPAAEPQ